MFVDAAAEFASGLSLTDVPSPVVACLRETVIDTIGVTLAGMSDPAVGAFAVRMADDSTNPTVRLLGTQHRADPMWAALVHGMAAVWHDFDGGNRFAGGHPAAHCIPAAIAAATGREISGTRFLEAVLAGYEIGARIGRGTTLRDGMHPHGTWATVGAAVTAALLRGFDAADVRETMNVSTSLTIASSWKAAFEGATVRNAFAGAGAASGVLAAELVAAGFTGERDGIATVFGELSGTSWDPEAALEELGERWEITFGYTKLFASARYLHSAVDATIDALRGETVVAADVERIGVRTYAFAASMNQPNPANPLAAKFSLPHAIAAQIVLGEGGIDAFEPPAVADPQIRSLAERVDVAEDVEMSRRTPDERPAAVSLHLRDGRVLRAERSLPHGDDSPISDDALRAKFIACAGRSLDEADAQRLFDELWSLAAADNVDDLW